jgi:formyltetrahydrofolate synthetase
MNTPRTDERDPEQIRLFKKLDNAVRKAAVAHDEMVAAQTRAHDLKLRVKSEHGAVLSLQRELSESQAKLRKAMLLNVDVAKQCGHAMGRAEAAEARAEKMEKALRAACPDDIEETCDECA